jgi:hypothetical protein
MKQTTYVKDIGILPRLGKAAVIPEDRAVVVSELALLDVLSDRVGGLLGGDFHFGLGVLGDLDDGVVVLARLQGDVVPGGDGLLAILEEKAIVDCARITGNRGGDSSTHYVAASFIIDKNK